MRVQIFGFSRKNEIKILHNDGLPCQRYAKPNNKENTCRKIEEGLKVFPGGVAVGDVLTESVDLLPRTTVDSMAKTALQKINPREQIQPDSTNGFLPESVLQCLKYGRKKIMQVLKDVKIFEEIYVNIFCKVFSVVAVAGVLTCMSQDVFQDNRPSLERSMVAQYQRPQNNLSFLQKEHPTACNLNGECNPLLEF